MSFVMTANSFRRVAFAALLATFGGIATAEAAAPMIHVVKKGAEKSVISLEGIRVSGANGRYFLQTLTRDLDLSGWFKTGPSSSIAVTGSVAEAGDGIASALTVSWPGKRFAWSRNSSGKNAIRQQAHQLSDEILKQILGEQGNAQSKICFANRKGSNNGDLYVCDANGMGVIQLTHDAKAVVGPRWSPDAKSIWYTSFLRGYPEIFNLTLNPIRKAPLGKFKGLNTGAAIAPDGRRAALVLAYQGNPELYVLDLRTGYLVRLTKTPRGAEASPVWSPDGGSIAYVSDVTGNPHIYIVNVASKQSRRITYNGSQNIDPDWNAKGQIIYASKRGGGYSIYTMPPSGDSSAQRVDAPYDAEHPSWAPDGRHAVCQSRGTLYLLDTQGDAPVRLFNIPGNWMNPCWSGRQGKR